MTRHTSERKRTIECLQLTIWRRSQMFPLVLMASENLQRARIAASDRSCNNCVTCLRCVNAHFVRSFSSVRPCSMFFSERKGGPKNEKTQYPSNSHDAARGNARPANICFRRSAKEQFISFSSG